MASSPTQLLRRLVREQLLSEVPLDYAGGIDNSPLPSLARSKKRPRYMPSIGHGVLEDEENRKVAVDYFRATKDSWAIVTLSSIEVDDGDQSLADSNLVDSEEFREQLRDLGLDLERTNVIVVLGAPYQGDYEDVRWSVVHDIVGHSIDREVSYKWSDSVKQSIHFIHSAEGKVWDGLPEEFQIASSPKKDDIRADIAAAVFLGTVDDEGLARAASAALDERWDADNFRHFVGHFDGDRERARDWFVPQFTKTWTRAVEIWKGKFDREGGRVRAIIPF